MMSNNLYSKEIMNSEMFDIENDQYIETPWSIIESYFSGQQLERFVRHQLESYNNFVGYQIIKTIEMFNPVLIASEQDMCRRTKKNKLEIVLIDLYDKTSFNSFICSDRITSMFVLIIIFCDANNVLCLIDLQCLTYCRF